MSNGNGASISRRVLDAISLFGSLKVVQILCSLVRTKIVAMVIGTAGVGLFGIFNSAIDFITQIALMGVGSSTTREVARHPDAAGRGRAVTIVRRWALALGCLGSVVTFLIAPWLSEWSFGDGDHAWAFRFLAVCVCMSSVSQAEFAILQGLGLYRRVARAMLVGSVGGTLVAVPLIFWLKIDSIVPVIVASMAMALIGALTWRERKMPAPAMTVGEVFTGGRALISLGFFMTLSDLAALASSYIFMAWLTTDWGSSTAGMFQAGFVLTNRYVGLVFSAIAMEFYPRLARNSSRPYFTEVMVSHEMKVVLTMLVPMTGLMSVCAPLLISLFYSGEFLAAAPFVEMGTVGTVFRGVAYCMSFVMLSRGDGRIYLVTEVTSSLVYVIVNMAVMKWCGIQGMGVAYAVWYGAYAVIVGLVFYRRYGMSLRRGIPLFIVYAVGMTAAIGVLSTYVNRWLALPLVAVAVTVSIPTLYRMRRR